MTGKLCSAQINTRILNWRAYGEGCAAANAGGSVGDNPHSQTGNPVAYQDWLDGFNGANPACCEVPSDGNLWKDPPDFVGTGWTDNGNGTYTCDGTDGTSLEVVLAGILDDTTYNVSINFISYTGGSIDVYLGGTNKFNENTGVAGGGVINFPLTTDQNFAPIGDTIIINSGSFVGTIGNISVVAQ